MKKVPVWTTVETLVLKIAKDMEFFYWDLREKSTAFAGPGVVRRRFTTPPKASFEKASLYREEPDIEPGVSYSYPGPYTEHERICIRALEDGKTVPIRVLMDYAEKPWASTEIYRRKRKGIRW